MKLTDSSVREMSLMELDIVVYRIESLSICDIFSCLDWESSISASSMASFRDIRAVRDRRAIRDIEGC